MALIPDAELEAKSFIPTGDRQLGYYPLRVFETPADVINLEYPIGHVRRYGAVGNGVHDDTAAWQAALTAAGFGGPGSHFKADSGTFLITDTLISSNPGVYLRGAGLFRTIVEFRPATARVLFFFRKADTPGVTNVLYGGGLKGMHFYGSPAALGIQKIAIKILDVSNFVIEDVATTNWTGNSGSALTPSIGLQYCGRELVTLHNYSFSADRPISMEYNTNVSTRTNDVDQSRFYDGACFPQVANEDSIKFQDGIFVTNLTIDGWQVMAGGKSGINFADTSSGGGNRSFNIRIANVRHEQASAAGGWCVNWTANTAGLLIENTFSADIAGGVRLRYTQQALLKRCTTSNVGMVALDVDNTCWEVEGVNCNFIDNTTIAIGTLVIAQQSAKMSALRPIASSFRLTNPSGPQGDALRQPVITQADLIGKQKWATVDLSPWLQGSTSGFAVLDSTGGNFNLICENNGSGSIRKAFRSGHVNASEALVVAGVDASQGNSWKWTLTAARLAGAPTVPPVGAFCQRITFTVIQNATGGWAMTWNAIFKHAWSDTGNTANKRSTIVFVWDGTNWNQEGAQSPWY